MLIFYVEHSNYNNQMSKVTFDIEFTVNGLVQLIGRASISRKQAEKVEGLIDNIDTVIRLDELQANLPMQIENPKFNKKGKKNKEKEKQKSVKLSEENQDEEEIDEQMEDAEEDEVMDIQPEMKIVSSDNQYNDYYDDENSEEQSQDEDIVMNFEKKKITKRQRGELQIPIELPLKKSRKKALQNEEDEQLKKMQKDEKRRQQMRKHIQAQRMDTLNQILNETGRKQRLRNQKQTKEKQNKENKTFRTLGDVPKVVVHLDKDNEYIVVHNTKLFSDQMLAKPVVIEKPNCYRCDAKSKYKVGSGKMVCSLNCYKQHQKQAPKTKMAIQA